MFKWIFFLTRQSSQDKPDIQLVYIWCKLWLLPYTQYRHHSRQTNFRFSFVLVEGRNKITYQHKQQLGNDSSLFKKEIQGNNSVHCHCRGVFSVACPLLCTLCKNFSNLQFKEIVWGPAPNPNNNDNNDKSSFLELYKIK